MGCTVCVVYFSDLKCGVGVFIHFVNISKHLF